MPGHPAARNGPRGRPRTRRAAGLFAGTSIPRRNRQAAPGRGPLVARPANNPCAQAFRRAIPALRRSGASPPDAVAPSRLQDGSRRRGGSGQASSRLAFDHVLQSLFRAAKTRTGCPTNSIFKTFRPMSRIATNPAMVRWGNQLFIVFGQSWGWPAGLDPARRDAGCARFRRLGADSPRGIGIFCFPGMEGTDVNILPLCLDFCSFALHADAGYTVAP